MEDEEYKRSCIRELVNLCEANHNETMFAGAGCLCICGQSCGKPKACQGLEILKNALSAGTEAQRQISELIQ